MRIDAKPLRAFLPAVLFLIVGTIYSSSTPFGLGADADYHLVSIWCAQGVRAGQCEEGLKERTSQIPSSLNEECRVRGRDLGVCLSDLDVSPQNSELIETADFNNKGLYPVTYYLANSVFVGNNVERSILLIRLSNISVFAVLFALALQVASNRAKGLLVLSVIAALPAILSILVFVTPQAWSLAGLTFSWWYLYVLLDRPKRDRSSRTVASVGFLLSALLCLGSRVDAVFYFAVISLVTYFVVEGQKLSVRTATKILLGLSATSGLVLLHPFVREILKGLLSGENRFPQASFSETALLFQSIVAYPPFYLKSIVGWLEVNSDPSTAGPSGILIALFLGVLLSHLVSHGSRKSRSMSVVVLAVPFFVTVTINQFYGEVLGNEFPPRYLAPFAAPSIGILLLLAEFKSLKTIHPNQMRFLKVLAIASTVWFMHLFIRTSVSGQNLNIAEIDLNNGVIWWNNALLSPMSTWLFSSVLLAISLFLFRGESSNNASI